MLTRNENNLMCFLAGFAAAIMLGLFCGTAWAHDITINNHYEAPSSDVTEVTYTGMGNDAFDKAMAMSAAGDTCVFDYATGWQACVGSGWYESESAINGSVVTRVDDFMLRFNLQSDTDWDEQAYGVGASWHF